MTTLGYVASSKKRLPAEVVARVSAILRELVDAKFGGNQTSAAKSLGLSQGHLSMLMQGEGARGPGLYTLMRMRQLTGRSIDDILGLPPTPADEMTRQLRETIEAHLMTQLKVKEAAIEAVEERALRARYASRAKKDHED